MEFKDDSDKEGDKMEEDEDKYNGGCRFEKVDSERNMPNKEVEIMDVDGDEPVQPRTTQGLKMVPLTLQMQALMCFLLRPLPFPILHQLQHGIETLSSLAPSLAQNPLPSTSTTNKASAQDQLPSGDDVNSWPKWKVQAWVLQDQGILKLGGGCVAEHCEEPEQVDEMAMCTSIGCNDNDQASLYSWMLHVVQMLTSSAISFDLCGNCAFEGKN